MRKTPARDGLQKRERLMRNELRRYDARVTRRIR